MKIREGKRTVVRKTMTKKLQLLSIINDTYTPRWNLTFRTLNSVKGKNIQDICKIIDNAK